MNVKMKVAVSITPETEGDFDGITRLHNLAFNQTEEGELVERLRKTSNFISVLSLVAKIEGSVVGHILFYPIRIKTGAGECNSLALAPMSIHPDYQKKGIGSSLLRTGLATAKRLGFRSVIVLGHSTYYPRFGFKPANRWGIGSPFEVPDDVFFAIELVKNGLKDCGGTVEYPKEFNKI
jgi:putative acetyltransferase